MVIAEHELTVTHFEKVVFVAEKHTGRPMKGIPVTTRELKGEKERRREAYLQLLPV